MENQPKQSNDNQKPSGFKVLTQYLKDFSFENPKAPHSILELTKKPDISLEIDIALNHIESKENQPQEELYEVILTIITSAKQEDKTILFHCELKYAGVFLLSNIPSEHVRPLLAIEAPFLLFPFARQIICEASRDAGMPPLLLDPVDFAALYYSNVEKPQGNA